MYIAFIYLKENFKKVTPLTTRGATNKITMSTTAQTYDEIVRILRVTRNNVEYEAERNKSQLLLDVATTLGNLATLVDNISTDLRGVKYQNKEREQDNANNFYMERFTKRV